TPSVLLSLFISRPPAARCLHALSLHDALPISAIQSNRWPRLTRPPRAHDVAAASLGRASARATHGRVRGRPDAGHAAAALVLERSEEHTSELQSRENLVCRRLLEKKKLHRSDS